MSCSPHIDEAMNILIEYALFKLTAHLHQITETACKVRKLHADKVYELILCII